MMVQACVVHRVAHMCCSSKLRLLELGGSILSQGLKKVRKQATWVSGGEVFRKRKSNCKIPEESTLIF